MEDESKNSCELFNLNNFNTNARALFEDPANDYIFKPQTKEQKDENRRVIRFMNKLERRLLKAVKKNSITEKDAYRAVEMVYFTHTSPFVLWEVEKIPDKSCIISKTAFMFFDKYDMIDFDTFMEAMHDIGMKWKYDFKKKSPLKTK